MFTSAWNMATILLWLLGKSKSLFTWTQKQTVWWWPAHTGTQVKKTTTKNKLGTDFPSVLIIRSFAAFSLVVFVDGCSVPWNVCRKSWGDVALRMCFYTHTHVCNKVYEFHPSQSVRVWTSVCLDHFTNRPSQSEIWTQFPLFFSSDRHLNRSYVNVKHLQSSPELIPIVCVHVNTTSEEMTATEITTTVFFSPCLSSQDFLLSVTLHSGFECI